MVGLLIYIVLSGLNFVFQSATKANAANGLEAVARYIAVRSNVSSTEAIEIMQRHIATSLTPNATVLSIGWTNQMNNTGCYENPNTCDNALVNNYRRPFYVVAVVRIPPILPLPFLPTVQTKLMTQGAVEVFGVR